LIHKGNNHFFIINIKKLKNIYFLLMLASGLPGLMQNAFGQKDSSGIYKTASDFKQNM